VDVWRRRALRAEGTERMKRTEMDGGVERASAVVLAVLWVRLREVASETRSAW